VDPLPFLGLALALGVKHAFDPDHLAAVGVFVTRAESPRRALGLGMRWGAGHMLTAGLLTVGLFLARDTFGAWLAGLGWLVAVTLVLVGALSLVWEAKRFHTHPHQHGEVEHEHRHLHLLGRDAHHAMFGIGVLHGLASNDELLVLLTASLGVLSLGGVLAGVGVFSVGVVAGMALFACALALPVVRARKEAVRRGIALTAAIASIVVGAVMLAGA